MVTIYCSGSIQKGSADTKKLYWSDTERQEIANAAKPVEVRYLRPDDPSDKLGDTLAMFGRDMYQVQMADFVVVDARERRGIGIGVEMVASRLFKTPLIVVAPRNTNYRMDKLEYRGAVVTDYIHPHVDILADVVASTFEEAGRWIREFVADPKPVKSERIIMEAIKAYEQGALDSDSPMQELLEELRRARNVE